MDSEYYIIMIKEPIFEKSYLKNPVADSPIDSTSACVAKDMSDTLNYFRQHGSGVSYICANQIGDNERIVAVFDSANNKMKFLYNPEIYTKRELQDYWEESLSRPGRLYNVKCYFEVVVYYFDENGSRKHMICNVKTAALIQSAISTLDGVLPEERASECAIIENVVKILNDSALEL